MGCGSSNTATEGSNKPAESGSSDSSSKGYKLVYFNARARGELSRLLFAVAGVQYEDKRVEFQDWQKFKSKTLLGVLPVLHVDDAVLVQSVPIARYLARKFGLAGKSPMDQALADIIVETTADIRAMIIPAAFEKDESKKATMFAEIFNDKMPLRLKYFEEMLSKNGNYFVGKSMTWADLAVMDIFDNSIVKKPDLFDDYPNLKAHRERMLQDKKIAEYVNSRPKTEF